MLLHNAEVIHKMRSVCWSALIIQIHTTSLWRHDGEHEVDSSLVTLTLFFCATRQLHEWSWEKIGIGFTTIELRDMLTMPMLEPPWKKAQRQRPTEKLHIAESRSLTKLFFHNFSFCFLSAHKNFFSSLLLGPAHATGERMKVKLSQSRNF